MAMKVDKALSLLTASNLLSNGVTFGVLILLSRLMSTEDYGALAICVSLIMQISFVLDFGIGLSLVRWFNSRDSHYDPPVYISAAIMVRAVSTSLFVMLLYPVYLFLQSTMMKEIDDLVIVVTLLAVIVMAWWNLFRSLNQALQEFNIYSVSLVALPLVRLLGVGLSYYYGSNQIELVLALTVLYIIAPLMVIFLNFIHRLSRLNLRGKLFYPQIWGASKQLLIYGRWVFASALLFPLVSNIPLWFLGMEAGLSAAGAFGVGLYFANAVAPVREAIRIYFFPKVMNFESVQEVELYLQQIVSKLVWSIPIILVVTFFAIQFQTFLNDEKYPGASFVIFIMVATQVITMFSSLVGALVHYFEKPRWDVQVNLLRVLISTAFAVVFVPKYGALAAALIASFSIVTGEIAIYWLVKREILLLKRQTE